jgi:hypothetical protein
MTAMHQRNDLQVRNVQRKIFEVQGLKKGTYILSAIVKQDQFNMKQKALKLQVFPYLVLSPSDLLLTPNMRYTLNI